MVKHKVRPDKLHVFAEWIREIVSLSHNFPGYLNTEVIRPTVHEADNDEDDANLKNSQEYVAIFRYDTYQHLQGWMKSPERQEMVDRIPEFSANKSIVYKYHSLEHWFTAGPSTTANSNTANDPLSSGDDDTTPPSSGAPPPRYKMVIVTTAVIYTQTLWIPETVARILRNTNLHPDVIGLLSVFCIVLLATYVLFPIVTRLLGFWLFPTRNYRDMLRELVPDFWRRPHKASSPPPPANDHNNDTSTTKQQVADCSTRSRRRRSDEDNTRPQGSHSSEEDCPSDDGNLENV